MSLPRYSEYKDSGVEWLGDVPAHWDSWRVSHAFGSIGSGTTPPSDATEWYADGTVPWVTTGELRETVIYETSKAVTQAAVEKFSALRIHPAGSLAIAMYGATIGMGAFNRLYAFLSQIFDYGNTEIEKRFIFYKRLIPLLDFGRERETVDLSKVVLTHHTLRNKGQQTLNLKEGENPKLEPMSDTGSGSVQEKEKALLDDIIQKVNGLFEGELSDNDQLVYVNGLIKGKLLENARLVQQAGSNSKEQFGNSPDLNQALIDAIMDSDGAHQLMTSQALNSERVREGLKEILLGPARLYEALRARSLPLAASR